MNILSLFDGMSCGLIAFTELGVPVDRYVAYEIDKYAIQTSKHNFPNVEQMGDVFKADFKQFEGFDMVIGGSPCTYWSIAQSADKREKTASGVGWELFSQYVRALKEAKPKFFLYENNKSMSKEIRMSITETFGFEPICINSALVSAQNRQRLYWVGKRNADGTYSKVDVKQPEDRGILLKDILNSGDDLTTNNKAWTLTASYNGAVAWNTIERCQRNMVIEPVVECVSSRGVYCDTGSRSKKSEAGTEQHLKVRSGGKTNTLTTVQKDNMVIEQVGAFPNNNGEVKNSLGNRIYSSNAKSVTLKANGGGGGAKTGLYAIQADNETNTPIYKVENGLIEINDKKYPIKLKDGCYIIRKLTVNECKRLQTVPDWYEFPVSNTQAYKMLGNGWTVGVIMHLLSSILKEENKNAEEH